MRPGWVPEEIWTGQDAYVIGGGPSLREFDWGLLRGKNTIGCNSAHLLGPDICKVVFFGDRKFFDLYQHELSVFPGIVVSNCTPLFTKSVPWLKLMKRMPRGLARGEMLGWSWNSGCAATNLALSFGASRVFLLGIDMKMEGDRHNWHERQNPRISRKVYDRFLQGFGYVQRDLPRVFPGRQVIRLVQSIDVGGMDLFPIETIDAHFGVQHAFA